MLLATGVYKARDMQAPGVGLPGIVPAMRYLTASNRVCLGDKVKEFDDGTLNAKGQNVVVIGGGDTAMDCVRTAVRQGAKSVTCLYRRDRENMPGSLREVSPRRGRRRRVLVARRARRPFSATSASPACARCACGWAPPTPPGRQVPRRSRRQRLHARRPIS